MQCGYLVFGDLKKVFTVILFKRVQLLLYD